MPQYGIAPLSAIVGTAGNIGLLRRGDSGPIGLGSFVAAGGGPSGGWPPEARAMLAFAVKKYNTHRMIGRKNSLATRCVEGEVILLRS